MSGDMQLPDSTPRRASDAVKRSIMEHEGFRARPYMCPAGVWTIGYGTTTLPDGAPVARDTPRITPAIAATYFEHDIRRFEAGLDRLVSAPVTQNQWDALVSLVYNIGLGVQDGRGGDFADSTLLRRLNAGDYAGASAEFPRWVFAGGRRLPGLVKRRAKEREMFDGR